MHQPDNRVRLLHIEPDDRDREAFSRIVAEKGSSWEVTHVSSLDKAREVLAESSFELIVAACEPADGAKLSEEAGSASVILLTRVVTEPLLSNLLKRESDDYLIKDPESCYLDVLAYTIQKTLRRRHIERQLRWTQERYTALFDRSMDLVYIFDLSGRFVDANPAALELLGYTKDEIPSIELRDVVAPEHMALVKERIEQVLRDGRTVEPAEFKLFRKDGSVVLVETKGSVVLHDGRPAAIQGIGRDITDRKRAEEVIRESEEKFRGLAENMNAAAGIVQNRRFVYVNRYMAQMLGYSVDEILKLEFPQLVHPSDREWMINRARQRQLGASVPSNYQFRALTKSGEVRWIDFAVGSMLYRGKPAIIGTGIDITEQKETEKRLQAHAVGLKILADSATRLLSSDRPIEVLQEIFEDLANHLGTGVFLNYLVTPDGARLQLHSYRGLNPSVARQIEIVGFGQTPCGKAAQEKRRVVIENVQQTVRPDAEPLRRLGIRAYACHPLLGHRALMGTLSFCSCDRDCFSEEELELMRLISHQAAMALEHEQLTEELARRAAELAEASAAKDHFLAVLSHELRTPLTPVVMGISMLQDKPDLDGGVRETLDMVRQNVEMEARLIDDLLDVTRIARGKIELRRSPFELRTVIQRAIEVCRPDIEAHALRLSIDLASAASCWVEGDISRLQQVFWNLLKNSVKFTPRGGRIEVRCQPFEKDVVVEVSDTGIGFEAEALPRIFNAFEQYAVSGRFGGLGLGLTISKALVELHGGKLEAYSAGRDQGATFRVRLPLCAPADQAAVSKVRESPATRPLRILLVEDHGATAQMIRRVLAEKNHAVETAGDVSTALHLAAMSEFDLLVSDLGLPDGSGHDLIRELRARGNDIPAIALSGYGQESDVRRSHEAGFAAHLTKPASREAVVETVESLGKVRTAESFPPEPGMPAQPVFDAGKALERCFGKPEMLREMMQFLPAECSELFDQMSTALARQDLAAISKAAHRLKGTVVYLAAQPATEAVLKLENAARSGSLAQTEEAITELKRQIQLLQQALAAHSPDHS